MNGNTKQKRGRKEGTKLTSKYEEIRDTDGTIDYHLAEYQRRGKKRQTDLSIEDKRSRAITHGTPQKMLQCPFCGKLTAKMVALDASGNPKRPPAAYIKYVEVDGRVERRFTGVPPADLSPITTQYRHATYGFFVNTKESIPPRFLKSVDADLFNDFKKILENTLHEFRY